MDTIITAVLFFLVVILYHLFFHIHDLSLPCYLRSSFLSSHSHPLISFAPTLSLLLIQREAEDRMKRAGAEAAAIAARKRQSVGGATAGQEAELDDLISALKSGDFVAAPRATPRNRRTRPVNNPRPPLPAKPPVPAAAKPPIHR